MKPMPIIWGSLVQLSAVLNVFRAMGTEATAPPGPLPNIGAPTPDIPRPMTDIHDIMPPISMGIDAPWLLPVLIIVAVVAIIAVVWWLWKKGKKNRAIETNIPELPPDRVAMRALEDIADVRRLDGKIFYFRLSAILRQYVFGRFSLGAPEMTTEEFLPCMTELSVGTDLASRLKRLCRTMDPVKFGAETAVEKQMQTDLAFVREFVSKTTPKIDTDDKEDGGGQNNGLSQNNVNSKKNPKSQISSEPQQDHRVWNLRFWSL